MKNGIKYKENGPVAWINKLELRRLQGQKLKYVRYGKEGQGRTGETVGVKIKVCDIVR